MALIMIGALFSQWPLGWLSDRFDRRRVMLGAALVGAAAPAVVAVGLVEPTGSAALAMMFVLGGATLPLYSLSLSQVNDYLSPGQMVGASGTLVFVTGWLWAHCGPAHGRLRPRGDGSAGFPAMPRRGPCGACGVHRLPDGSARGEAGRGAGGLRSGDSTELVDAHRAGGGGGARARRIDRLRVAPRAGFAAGSRGRGRWQDRRLRGAPAARCPSPAARRPPRAAAGE